MNQSLATDDSVWKRALISLILLGLSLLIAVQGYLHGLPRELAPWVKSLPPLIFLALTLVCYASRRLRSYWKVMLGFFSVSFGLWMTWLLGDALLSWLGLSVLTPQGVALAKVSEALPVIFSMLFFTWLVDRQVGTINLQKGRLGLSLLYGLLVSAGLLLVFAGLGGVTGMVEAGLSSVLAVVPVALIFAVTNGFYEEVWYRGLFLSRFTDLTGARLALAVTTLAFGGMHFMTGYTGNAGSLGMVIITLFLGLACGLIVQKTSTLWGAVLAHTAADLFYIFAYFAALP